MPPVIQAAMRPLAAVPPQNLSLRAVLQAGSGADGADAADVAPLARVRPHRKPASEPGTIPEGEADWSQLVDLVQDFGARMRRAGALAQDLTARSQEVVKTNRIAAEAATARADRAEAAARDNAVALERLREQVRAVEERARLAEERACLAEERVRIVEASEAEARGWLHTIRSALRSECDGLGDLLVSAAATGGKAA